MTPRNTENETSKGSPTPLSTAPTIALETPKDNVALNGVPCVSSNVPNRNLHIVLDIDETLVAGPVVESEEQAENVIKYLRENQVNEPIIITRHQSLIFIHIVHRGASEFIRYLFLGLGAKVSFFSAAIQERNVKFVPEFLALVFGAEYGKITGKVDIFSPADLDKEENAAFPTKNLRKILKDEKDLSNTVLIDNDEERVSRGLEANAIIALGPEYWLHFVGTGQNILWRLNNIFYIAGVLDSAYKQNGKSLAENLQELTFTGDKRMDSLDERALQYYHQGLVVLQKYKPDLQFYRQSQAENVPSEFKQKAEQVVINRKPDPHLSLNAKKNSDEANEAVKLINTLDEQKTILRGMGFGTPRLKNPATRDLNDFYWERTLACAVKIWGDFFKEKTEITKEEFRDACYQYFYDNALLGDRNYLQGLMKDHLEKLYEIYSWTRCKVDSNQEYKMGITQFCHVFLFLNQENSSINNGMSLAEAVDALHAQKKYLTRLRFASRSVAEDLSFTQPVITLGEGAVEKVEDKQNSSGYRIITHGLGAFLHVNHSDPFPLLYFTPVEMEGKSMVGFTSRDGKIVHKDLSHLDNLIEELKINKFTSPNLFLPQLFYSAPVVKMTEVKKEEQAGEGHRLKSEGVAKPILPEACLPEASLPKALPKPKSEPITKNLPQPKNGNPDGSRPSNAPSRTENRTLRYGSMFTRSLEILRAQVPFVFPNKKSG